MWDDFQQALGVSFPAAFASVDATPPPAAQLQAEGGLTPQWRSIDGGLLRTVGLAAVCCSH